jgi:hypothetical protein
VIKICTLEPSVPHADGGSRAVKDTAGMLLRLLLLAPDSKVPVDAAVAVMPIVKSSIGRYVAELRSAFGNDDLVARANGVIQYTGDRTLTDAAVVENKHNALREVVNSAGEVDPALARELLPTLLEIQTLYRGNPSIGLDQFSMDEVPSLYRTWAMELDEIVSEWVQRWNSVQLMLADCRMLSEPTKQTGLELLKGLFKIARDPDPAEEVFPRLLEAARLSGDVRQHRNAWDLTQRFYLDEQMGFPEGLRALAPPSQKVRSTPWDPYRGKPLHMPLDYVDPIHEIARILGITSVLKLRGQEVEPAECIERTNHQLYFSGVLASKWVMDAGIRAEFDALLSRLDGDKGDVRFLIIDPDGDAYQQLFQLRGGRLSRESVPYLQRLQAMHSSFQVRVVNALPAFRIVVIDSEFVTFSPYALDAERYATSKLGWEAPHVMLDPLAPYPLSDAFRLYFEERWSTAKELEGPPPPARRTV